MKPPEEIYNKVQDAVFDYAGRPKHNFFYTSKPLYTQSLYDLAENISQVMAFGDRMNRYLIMINFKLLFVIGILNRGLALKGGLMEHFLEGSDLLSNHITVR